MSKSNIKPVSPAAKAVGLMRVLTSTRIGLTAAMLRDRIPDYQGLSDAAFERAFERDKSRLRSLGIELTVEKLEADALGEVRYRIDLPAHRLPELHLSDQERLVTALAAAAVGGSGWGSHARRASVRLGGVSASSPGVGAGARAELSSPPDAAEALILAALCEYPVSFDYRAANGEHTERRILPWGVGQQAGRWYVFGGDIERGGERMFRLDRIQGSVAQANVRKAEMVHEIYGRPDKFSMRDELARLTHRDLLQEVWVALAEGAGAELKARGRSMVEDRGVEVVAVNGVYSDVIRECAAVGAAVVGPGDVAQDIADTALIEAALAAHDSAGEDQSSPRLRLSAGGRPSTDQVLADVISLASVIQSEGAQDIDELATRFAVPRSEIERWLATLELGAHIVEDVSTDQASFGLRLDGNTVELSADEELTYPLNVSLQEATALLLGCELLLSVPGLEPSVHDAADAVVEKLTQARAQLNDFSAIVAIEPGQHRGETLRFAEMLGQAIAEQRTVHMRYASFEATTERNIDPLTLVRFDDKLYVRAWCHLRGEERTFNIERIVNLEVTDRQATHTLSDERPASSTGFPGGDPGTEALLGFGRDSQWMVSSFRPSVTRRTDTEVIARVNVVSAESIARTVAETGGDVRIVSPPQLRDDVRAALEDLLESSRLCRTVGTELVSQLAVTPTKNLNPTSKQEQK
ncbi:WYL domain-containing protein [Pseudoglutamicibacter cumminsii]|uniref:WYL domain-containing protein n=1 Tax=Pseudoglutamicibacter cumminsii TaxID=156979 RepID=A0AAP4FDW4_9MICC|nr:WYL domain-containing protein [Pseudoglutamicibacter cumminsii]MDK6275759.1 WYL domain-containing protein [Pseudoglutamicibacter cumminsii]